MLDLLTPQSHVSPSASTGETGSDPEWEALRSQLATAFGTPQPAFRTRDGLARRQVKNSGHAPTRRRPADDKTTPVPPQRLSSLAQAETDSIESRRSFQICYLKPNTVVAVKGNIDADAAPLLRKTLSEAMQQVAPERLLAADLRASRFSTDAVWSALVQIHLSLSLLGRRLFVVLPPDGPMARQMTALGLDTLLTRISSPQELKRLG